jgi:hypothetical protein
MMLVLRSALPQLPGLLLPCADLCSRKLVCVMLLAITASGSAARLGVMVLMLVPFGVCSVLLKISRFCRLLALLIRLLPLLALRLISLPFWPNSLEA